MKRQRERTRSIMLPVVAVPTEAENRDLSRRAQAGNVATFVAWAWIAWNLDLIGLHDACMAIVEDAARARNECVERNTPLVAWIVRKFPHSGWDIEDMIQEGLIGLAYAIDNYDPRRDVAFSSFATVTVRNEIRRWIISKSRLIRVSRCVLDGGKPYPETEGESIHRRRARVAMAPIASLDVAMPGRVPFARTLPDREEHDPAEQIEWVKREMESRLDDRERAVLYARIWGGRTLTNIGADLGVCKERVRQIESGAIRKLREAAIGEGVAP